MKWIKENIKTALVAFSVISATIGFIIGVHVTQREICSDIQFIKNEIESIRDNDLWLIRQWINRAN